MGGGVKSVFTLLSYECKIFRQENAQKTILKNAIISDKYSTQALENLKIASIYLFDWCVIPLLGSILATKLICGVQLRNRNSFSSR